MPEIIRVGPAGIPISAKGRGIVEGIKKAAELGLSALEVQFGHGVNMGLDLAKKAGAAAKENDILLSVHAPYFINLNSEKKGVIDESKRRLLQSVAVAEAAGAYVVVFHAGFYSDDRSGDATDAIKENLLDVREKTPADIFLGVETMGRANTWGTLEEIGKVCGKGVVPVLDFAHIHARGRRLDSREKVKELFDEYESIFTGFLHSHFTGIAYGELGEKNHLPVSGAEPDFNIIAPFLMSRKYRCTVICESPLLDIDALKLKGMLGL